jgi:hypothetical protein
MKKIDQAAFNHILQQAPIKPRLKKDLKFITSTSHLSEDWSYYELIPIVDRTGNRGVLLLQPDNDLYIAPYELHRNIIDSKTGRNRAIICDFCYTWQPGSNAASITFTNADKRTTSFLCCGDLLCSAHVRTTTKAAIVSRAQLRENLSNEERVTRLKLRLSKKIEQLQLTLAELL